MKQSLTASDVLDSDQPQPENKAAFVSAIEHICSIPLSQEQKDRLGAVWKKVSKIMDARSRRTTHLLSKRLDLQKARLRLETEERSHYRKIEKTRYRIAEQEVFGQRFIEVCKSRLSREQFLSIIEEAKK